jgi:FkbM family methyltransferase
MRKVVRPDDVVFDIGANIGVHSVALSKMAGPRGRLCVFEPNPELLPQLRLTVEGLGNAKLYPFALSDKSDVSTLFIPENAEMGSLANWTAERDGAGEIHTINCEVRRIDDLISNGDIPLPDFIKCDIEGAELMAFKGANAALDRIDAPIILFEANIHNTRGFGFGIEDAKNYLDSL